MYHWSSDSFTIELDECNRFTGENFRFTTTDDNVNISDKWKRLRTPL